MIQILHRNQPIPEPFPKGAMLLIDKPLGWTSFDVVNKVRYRLKNKTGNKKLKVGHAGTLDPLATGLLIICVGDHTKMIDNFQAMPKAYSGTLTLGATTSSYDLEKPADNFFPTEHLTEALIDATRRQFIGEIQQVPPMYSAVKVDGKRLYKNARTGQVVELEPRTVAIEKFELSALRPVHTDNKEHRIISSKGADIHLYPDYEAGLHLDFTVECSKGTYIRSLAHDFGAALESGAFLSALRRTGTGGYSVNDAWTLDELLAVI